MSATPLRAELQSRAVGSGVRLLLGIGIAVAVVAVAGRAGDLNLSLWEVVAGLVAGGIALLLDIEIDNLVLLLAIALGAVVGDDASGAFLLGRYERDQVGTVYRVEDPSGTDAGLAWLPGRGE
jgi:hypothetical protein